MLDLDRLAEQRAESLQQQKQAWKDAVWSAPFQQLTQSMTDGEVEGFIALCPSVLHFHNLVRFLDAHIAANGGAPFAVLRAQADKSGLALEAWVRKQCSGGTPA